MVCSGYGEISHGSDDDINRMLDCYEHFRNATEAHRKLLMNLLDRINEKAKENCHAI